LQEGGRHVGCCDEHVLKEKDVSLLFEFARHEGASASIGAPFAWLGLLAVSQHPSLLPKRDDPSWSALDCFVKCSPRHPTIADEGNQLLKMRI
jgi:hypothetical protein